MTKQKVVVTGLGAVTPLGNDLVSTWEGILAGRSGVNTITKFDVEKFRTKICAEVKDFDVSPYLDAKQAGKLDKFIHYGIAACQQALDHSGLDLSQTDLDRAGVFLGSGIGGLPMIQNNAEAYFRAGARRISPFFIPGSIINMLSGYVSMIHGLQGPNISAVTACTTSTHCIGLAMRLIQYGDADVMICGGSEMTSCEMGIGGFTAMRALSTRNDEPTKASRPWDKDRDGFVLGDGSGVLVLESEAHAKARGANILAELSGFGTSSDAYHMTATDPEGRGGFKAMRNALNDAGRSADEVDYINAHGTSTPVGDIPELNGIRKLLGPAIANAAVSSTKSMTGHLLGAAGGIEAIFGVLSIMNNIVPPTINLDHPDVGTDGFNLVAHIPQKKQVNCVLSNSFGFGGTNGTLAFTRY